MKVHVTATIEPGARIDPSVTIGAFCVVSREAVLGPGVHLYPHTVIEGRVKIREGTHVGIGATIQGPTLVGSYTKIFPYAVVGQPGQYPDHHRMDGAVEIGSEVVIREFVAVNKPVSGPATRIGDGCYIMARAQVDHDCIIEDFVKIATGVTLGGSVHIEDHAYLGMNAVVHQGIRIGRACMIGMNGVVTAHVPPFTTLINRRISRINSVGLARIGATETDIARVEAFYRNWVCNDVMSAEGDPWVDAIYRFIARVAPSPIARFAPTT